MRCRSLFKVFLCRSYCVPNSRREFYNILYTERQQTVSKMSEILWKNDILIAKNVRIIRVYCNYNFCEEMETEFRITPRILTGCKVLATSFRREITR